MNLFPENTIGGYAVAGNFGMFVTNHLSVGGNIAYCRATNSFRWNEMRTDEKFSFFGIQAAGRYYFPAPGRLRFYGMLNIGAGAFEIERSVYSQVAHGYYRWLEPAATVMAGAGFNFFLTGRVALDFNTAYTALMVMGYIDPYFQSVLPTLGVQVFLERNPS